jgi:mono/diheme cytochrome c family protein
MSARRGIGHRHKLLFSVIGAGTLILVGAGVGFVVLLSGAMSTAATTQHFWLTHRLLELGLRISVNAAARDIDVPPLDESSMIDRGEMCFRQHCVRCHGAPPFAPSEEGRGMLPIPGPLIHAAREWSPASLYYITKKGIRMTGMPAWEFRISDEGLWSIVAYLTSLPRTDTSAHTDAQTTARSGSCPPNTASPAFTSTERGDMLLRQYACHSCHRIEGVIGPKTYVGPPLIDWSQRKYIAGVLPNTRANLTRWIEDPQAVSPGTLMPKLDVPAGHAEEMAIFLLAER